MPRGTVHAAEDFDASADAECMEKAMKGLGTDEKAIIELLSRRTVRQRQEIAKSYKSLYGKDLEDRLHSELSHHFRMAVLYSFYDMAHVNAKALYKAIKGAGTDERVLIDVICTADNRDIEALKQAYHSEVHHDLEKDVQGDTSGDFRCLLVALLQGKRESDTKDSEVTADCEQLYKSGEARLGTDEAVFTRIMANRSYEHIRKMNQVYTQAIGHDLIKAIKNETSGDYRDALVTIVQTALNKYDCAAELFMGTMKGAGTHDDNLTRMVMAHSEVDLQDIKDAFERRYDKTLAKRVESDTSGDYKRFLVAIIGN